MVWPRVKAVLTINPCHIITMASLACSAAYCCSETSMSLLMTTSKPAHISSPLGKIWSFGSTNPCLNSSGWLNMKNRCLIVWREKENERERKTERESDRKCIQSETWPRLEPGPTRTAYMQHRSP